MSTWSLTSLTPCQPSQNSKKDVDYADTVSAKLLTMLTPIPNFEGYTQILKDQSRKKKYFGVFTCPLAVIKKYENGWLHKAKILCPRSRFSLYIWGPG